MIMQDVDQQHLLRTIFRRCVFDTAPDRRRIAQHHSSPDPQRRRLRVIRQPVHCISRGRDRDAHPHQQMRHHHPGARCQMFRLGQCVGADRPDRDGGFRGLTPGRWLELTPVGRGNGGTAGVDEIGKAIGQPGFGGPAGAIGRGTKQPAIRLVRTPRQRRPIARKRVPGRHVILKIGEEFGKLVRKIIRAALTPVALQGIGGCLIRPRCPPQTQINPVRIESGEDRKTLGHLQRGIVRQHDAATANPNARRCSRNRPDQHLGRGSRECRRGMMFGEPIPMIAQPVGGLGQVDGVSKRVAARGPTRDRRLVEHGEAEGHGLHIGA